MSPSTLAFFELEPWEQETFRKQFSRLKGITSLFFSEPLSSSTMGLVKEADVLAIFIYSKITDALLAKLPKLRFIATMSTGFDHIDMEACRKRGIMVSNVPSYGENTVAEHTFGLILALSRKIVPSVARTRKGDFSLDGLRGFDLKGKTLGVIGTGHIGLNVLRIAQGFGMTCLAFDVMKNQEAAKTLGFSYVSLNALLRQSDIVTLHCPYNEQTHHLINKGNIGHMKQGALLLNTARGGLIETSAILQALDEGRLAGVGLDVLEEEAAIKEEKQLLSRNFSPALKTVLENHILLNYENVIITPHNAFNSTEAIARILATTAENVNGYLKKKPVNIVINKKTS